MIGTIKKIKTKYFIILSLLLLTLTLIITLSEPTFAVEPLPNIYISNVIFYESRQVDQVDTFTVTIMNGGTVDAGSFRVDMYDNPIPEPPVLLQEGVSNQQVAGLTAGSSTVLTFTRSWSTVGSHKIYFQSDTLGEVAESIESNVIKLTKNINVWDYPDLIVQSITAPPTVMNGETADITVVIKNQGQVTFNNTDGIDISLFTNLSNPPSLYEDDPTSQYYFYNDLAPGETYSRTFRIRFNAAGLRRMYAYVDFDDTYDEKEEDNNYFGPVELKVITRPVAIIDSIAPNTATKGQNVIFTGRGTDSDPGSSITEYSWRSSIDGVLSNQAVFNKNNLSVGQHTIFFKVKDNDGLWSDEVSAPLNINAIKPVAIIDSITPNPATKGQNVIFTGRGTDPDSSITEYSWRSSINGVLSNQAVFNRNNLSIGQHTIFFKVKNSNGMWSDEVSTSLNINAIQVFNTKLTLSAKPKVIKKGKAATLNGKLVDNTGKGIAGKIIQILAGNKVIKKLKTDANGNFNTKVKPKSTTKYKAAFKENSNYKASNSKPVIVKVVKK